MRGPGGATETVSGTGRSCRAGCRSRGERGHRGSRSAGRPRRRRPARPFATSSVTSANSWYEPIVDPMISICLKNSRGRFSSTEVPDVPPQSTSRPPDFSARTDWSHVAGPTLSTTTSAAIGHLASAESNAASAPSSSGWVALHRIAGGDRHVRADSPAERERRADDARRRCRRRAACRPLATWPGCSMRHAVR